MEAPQIVDRYELIGDPGAFRRACESGDVSDVAIHSVDWEREVMPQLYTVAIGAARGRRRWVIDEGAGTLRRISAGRNALRVGLAPLGVAAALISGLGQAGRFLAQTGPELPLTVSRGDAEGEAGPVLAIWSGDIDATVGGAVTHISGVLAGFRRAGLRVGLVTTSAPPDQILDAVDDFVVAAAPSTGARLTPELAALAADEDIVEAADLLAERMGSPGFVYQRHAALRMAGVRIARAREVPLVLEWNASAAWVFTNWAHAAKPLKRLTARLIAAIERRVAQSASSIAAVSDLAGEMALEVGAEQDRVVTVPNAVDIAELDAATAAADPAGDGGPLVGWVGSFGDWHGAEVLIRSIRNLPAEANVIMIGDGRGRAACQELAGELDVADRVTWHGRTDHDRALQLLSQCDVLTAPTVPLASGQPFFGSPTKIFEYMALNKPIVASRLGQIADVLETDRTALLVPPGDEHELGAAISALIADPERGRRLAEAARVEIESAHTWDHRAAAILTAVGNG